MKVLVQYKSIPAPFSRTGFRLAIFVLLAGFHCSCSGPVGEQGTVGRPNILLLVADDLGYADLGCYGGDIETPNIDRLASQGIRFSSFHTAPMCAPTRAMLLSGNDNHIAGIGRQGLVTDEPGYEGRLTERVATIPQVLRAAGYHTYMAGKWHLGHGEASNPHAKGFEHSFALLEGAGNHYNDQGLFASHPVSPYTEDGQPAGWKDGDYSTDLYTDKLIACIDRHRDDKKPFFAFAAYTSPHWPLQVDEQYWRKYEGRYDAGYEVLRRERLESLKKAGMIPQDAVLPPAHDRVIPWDSLTPEEKKKESRKMELYAGMVDNLDHNIGRLIGYLQEAGLYENTLIIFMSDNGAASEDFYYHDQLGPFIRQNFNDAYENMGQPDCFVAYGPQWAEAGSAPFRYFKGYATEGGIVAPMVIAGPGISREEEIHHGFLTLMDIAPTCYEVAGTRYPEHFAGNEVVPLAGRSLMPFASGSTDTIHPPDYVFGLEHGNRAMIRKGNWKIVSSTLPFREEHFGLYNLDQDPAEQHDLREAEPEIYREMLTEWDRFSETVKVQVPTPRGK